ncbi:MAG TPA: NAD-dependent epimerase/dehydratase family protein [Pyrinomonadaceae bacterium]|nr:NAD-dependent epimerase/dehydratase family protein [Pyrinomonadaceae bacterium]
MRIVVVGGGGFIGSALLKHLSARHECVCFGHGGRFAELREKIGGGVEYVEGDVTDARALRGVMRGADASVYAAGTGGEADCLADPTRSLLAHVYGAQSAARAAAQANVARFVFTSTIAVYGTYQARPMPLTEEAGPRPDEFYGALKATAERALIDSGRFRILRLSNVYGYGGGLFSLSSGVAGKFVELISRGRPLKVFGDGSQRIDYVHVDDVCRAYELALGSEEPESFVYNVGGGRPVSVRELAETASALAEELTGARAEIEYAPAPPDKLWPDRRLSVEKIERELGWRPRVSIEEGLREMLTKWTRESVGS